jgi:hypothetical protein
VTGYINFSTTKRLDTSTKQSFYTGSVRRMVWNSEILDSCCKATAEEKVKIFFGLYDTGSKGYITKEEFNKMVQFRSTNKH